MKALIGATGLALLIGGAAGQAQDRSPGAVAAVVDCRSQTDSEARLRCYDAAVDALAAASASGALAKAVKAEERRREKEEEIQELAANIRSVGKFGYEKWRIELDQGGTWETIESHAYHPLPKPGEPVMIRRSLLGSYTMSIDGDAGIRVRKAR